MKGYDELKCKIAGHDFSKSDNNAFMFRFSNVCNRCGIVVSPLIARVAAGLRVIETVDIIS